MPPQLLPIEVDVLEVVPAVVGRQAFLLVRNLGLALDEVPLKALLRHLVLGIVGTNHLLVIKSLHSTAHFESLDLLLYYYQP